MKTLLSGALLCISCSSHNPAAHPSVQPTQSSWVDLRPQMQLRIENAYYREGMPKNGVQGYLGTEVAHYQVRTRGLRLLSVEAGLKQPPRDQLPVQELVPASQRRHARYRYFYAVVFNHRGNIRGSVLLGAQSFDELDNLGAALFADPESICGGTSAHCVVFPEMCTVSIEIEILVNGVARTVSSGSMLASVTPGAHHVEVLRHTEGGQLAPLKLDSVDPKALRIPLLHGDHITWN